MSKFIRIAIDLGKNYFQVHGLESEGGRSISRKIKRSKVHEVCSQIEPCRVGMEACGSAHYWARELTAMGHEVVLIPPAYIKPYVKRGKNDAVDAAAICEAMSRPNMRFVPVKSAEQQAVLMLHKTRDLLVKQRTMAVNALRGHLAEPMTGRLQDFIRNDASIRRPTPPARAVSTRHQTLGTAFD